MKFKKGMRVRIAKKVEKAEGWKDQWVKEMDSFLDRYGDIVSVKKDGSCDVKIENITLNFHQSSLVDIVAGEIGTRVVFRRGVSVVRGIDTDLPMDAVRIVMGEEGVIADFRATRGFDEKEMVYVKFPFKPQCNYFYWHISCFDILDK